MKKLSLAQKVKVFNLLQEHLEILDNGYCRYADPDISDHTLASWIAADDAPFATAKHISGIRLSSFGKLRDRIKPILADENIINGIRDDIARLTDGMLNTNKQLAQLIAKHDKLCQSLSVNKVLDVRHLTMLNDVLLVGKSNGATQTQQ